ncbi:MAG: hypothetical protein JWP89_4639 [Schlesneria sp.]|nr:hypothetical protein [Schlesneria sp.]
MGSTHPKGQRHQSKVDNDRATASAGALVCSDINQIEDSRETISEIPTHSTGSPMPADSHTELADLRQQLDGKNELVAALVAELEQVVEQLDRVKRNGSDRGRSSGGSAALPAEVVEEHQQVLGEMQRMVQQWEEMQAASSLGRIESELADLRAMLSKGYSGHSDPTDDSLESVMSRLSMEPPESPSSMVTLSGTDWEAMKRQMMDESGGGPDYEVEDDLTKLLDGLSIPTAFDFETASVETLKKACADRDNYIVQINRWVRTRRAVSIPENWDDIDAPEEVRERAELLTSRLEEQVRLAEVEMSLERARLSREKSQVQADRAVIEKHLKRLGISSLDELEDISVSNGSTGDRRWMRFLGVNRKS